MPTSLPSVPLLEQELRYSCVPACARMALGYLGLDHGEPELRILLRTSPEGTDFGNLADLASLGVEVRFFESGIPFLEHCLECGCPPVVPLESGFLPHWDENCNHAAVVVGIDDTTVSLNDPSFPDAPRVVAHADFLRAWGVNRFLCALILPAARDG